MDATQREEPIMADQPTRPTGGLTPYLTILDSRGTEACDFYVAAFAADVIEKNFAGDGERLMHAGLKINDGWLMLSDSFPEYGHAPQPPASVGMHLQVDDADAWYDRAVAAGATPTMPVSDMFWGDRYGQLQDPFGHSWSIGSPIRG
jgi:PhnB protein